MSTPTSLRFLTAVVGGALLALPGAARAADELEPLAKAIEERPDDPAAYKTYAFEAMKRTRNDDAIAKLKLGVARVADFVDGYYMLGAAYRNKQQWADAAVFYRAYIVVRPNDPNTFSSYYGLAKSLAGLGDNKGAAAMFKKYLATETRQTAQKYIDDAKAELSRLEPPAAPAASPTTLRADAEKLKNDKKYDEAVAAYRKAIDADKGNLDLYNDLGNVFFAMKRYDDAAQAFKDAVGKDPSYALGWYNLAHALRKGERRAESVEAYKRYIKLKPDDPDPYYGLGQTLKQLGDVPGAITAFRKYVDMEKRPAEQKWVEKARQELAQLEASQKPAGGAAPQDAPGKVSDEK